MQSVWGWVAARFAVVAVCFFAVLAIGGSAYAAPQISAINPASGPLAGGNTLTITGTDLQSVTSINFGGIPDTNFTIDSPTQITVTVPAGVEGNVDITLSVGDYTTEPSEQGRYGYVDEASVGSVDLAEPAATNPVAFGTIIAGVGAIASTTYAVIHNTPAGDQAPPPVVPAVTGVSPAAGLTLGGAEVTITGSGFTGASAVSFGGVAAASFQLVSDTTITAVAPAGSAGTIDITVTTPGGTSATSAADRFTYYVLTVLTNISPDSGPTAGGTIVTVTGVGFVDVSGVTFGGVDATSFTVDSPSQITAVAPAGAAGTVDLIVTVPLGYTTGSYTYIAAPVVSSISPVSGPEAGATTVTISGSGFSGATAVFFGATPAGSFVVVGDGTITAVAPAGTGTVDVTVTTPGGTSATSGDDQFTYFASPTITGVSPASGASAGGTSTTISGTNFTGATGVTFGGTAATSFTVVNSNTITAVTPAGSTGTVDVTVTTPGGSATAVEGFTYIAAPEIGPISPSSGPEAGGTTVTISGVYLANATAVTFGGAAATITNDTPTSLTVLSPAGSAGAVDVVVTTAGGSDTKIGGFTYAGVPAVASLSPNEGSTSGGQTITVTGSGFTDVTDITFGGTPAAGFTLVSDSQITATTPAGVAGAVDVTVTTPGGTSAIVPGDEFTYFDMPTITTILPASGPLAGGTSVTISGSNLTGTTSVLFDITPAISFTVVNATTITATAPAGTAAGAVDVVVTTPGGSATASGGYTYVAAPEIASISPTSGSEAGNTTVTISGVNFGNATGVTFGGFAGTITANTPVSLTVLSPAGTGTVDVVVTTPGGNDTEAGGFTYVGAPVVTSLSSTEGSTAGGETITINGSGFTEVTGVSFGASAASNVTFVSDSQVTAVSPGGVAGTVDVTVTTPSGTSATSVADEYTFFNAPTVSTITPSQGPLAGGASVTLTGSGFTGASSVSFGDDPAASFVVDNDGQITATTPAGPGAGAVDVVVAGPGGSATASEGYTYLAAPEIASISPTSGSEAGGTSVTITGVHFSNASSVTFGGIAAMITANTPTSIVVESPAGSAGSVDVMVTTAGGSDTRTDGFTYAGAPVVTSLSSTEGSTSGGETITINGSGFTGATDVAFGGSAAISVAVISDTLITAISPGGPAGTVDVTVTTPVGTSAVSAADEFTLFNQPMLSSLSPSSGPAGGGASVMLTGSGFTGATSVYFGPNSAIFSVDNDGQITATSPAGTFGTVDVSVSGPGGSATAASSYTYVAQPTVTDISPASGPLAGSTEVTITGTNLSGVTSVTFGGAAASLTASAPTSITVLTPAGTAGAVDVVLTTPGGSATSTDGYTYVAAAPVVTGISPTGGPEAGGTPVTITGSGFLQAIGATFGIVPGSDFTIVSDTEAVVTAPAASGGPGMVHITVTASSGSSENVSADVFTYYAEPQIQDIWPNTGSDTGGDPVTITGSGLGGATDVTFGGSPATFAVVNASTISVTTPSGMAGSVDVTVTTPGGSSTISEGFTYTAPSFARTFGPLGLGMNGTVTIKEVTVGGDGVFTFTSPTPNLNLSVTTNGGAGQSTPVSLAAGDYTVTAAHRAGFGVTSITCDDDDSVGDLGGQRASITLAAGENVSCTFTSFASEAATTGLIQDFLTAQGSVILANLPGEQRRIDRLNDVVDVPGSPVPVLMGYLPQAAEGTLPMPTVSASLAEINAITGKPKSPFDAWFQATLGTFGSDSLSGRFGIVSLGADYLLSPDILVGGFLQVDVERDATDGTGGTISGTGWLAGPYATIRLADNVYLDLLAGVGTSSNSVSPDGTYTDDFDATRWLVSGSLTGQWQIGDWTFLPTASLSYFQSTSEAYVDGLGVDIPSVTGGLGQATLGPKVSYSFDLGDGIHVRASVGLEGVLEVATDTDGETTTELHGRAHAGVDFSMPGGATLGVSGTYDGIGSTSVHSTSGRVNLSMPIN